jgi:exo-1,4-beta-D-glucosaminidase
VWFLDLRLHDAAGDEIARNFYWLSTEPDVLDYENNLWYVTPTKGFADFTALDELPEVELEISATGSGDEVKVRLANPSDALAFFIELRVVDADGNSILPVLWDDNYVSILPGESRELTARFLGEVDLSDVSLAVQGWNVGAVEIGLVSQ